MPARLPLRACLGLALAAGATAQEPADAPAAIVALLRDPSGAPVAGARGWLAIEPAWSLPALADGVPERRLGPMPMARPLLATSDGRGVLRFVADGATPLFAGSGYVVTEQGLGALVPRLLPGRATRLQLAPLGAVAIANGSETFTLWARARLADGATVDLPPQTGQELRLPAGDYEAWTHAADGWTWQRLRVRPGQRTALPPPGTAQLLTLAADCFVHPAGWPMLDLGRGTREVLLRDAALAAPLVTWSGAAVLGPRVVPGPPTGTARPWPDADGLPDATDRFAAAADTPEGAVLFALTRRDDGTFRICGGAALASNTFRLPPPDPGETWLLLLAEGRAPTAFARSTLRPGLTLGAARGVPLVVDARDEQGLPVVDLAVDYVPDAQDPARVAARSDARGRADLGHVVGPGLLRISDARYRNRTIELDRIPAEPLSIVAAAGASCRGTVAFADGASLANATVVVTLRDPRGVLRPAERAAVVGDDGSFRFGGLPEDRDFVLFATAIRDGVTWSGRLDVRAGDDAVVLQLANEDPDLAPRRR